MSKCEALRVPTPRRPDLDTLMDNFRLTRMGDRLSAYLELIESPLLQTELVNHPYTAGNIVFSLLGQLRREDQPKALIALEQSSAFKEMSKTKPLSIALPFEAAVLSIVSSTSKTPIPKEIFEARDRLIAAVFQKEAERPSASQADSTDTALLARVKASVNSGEIDTYRPQPGIN